MENKPISVKRIPNALLAVASLLAALFPAKRSYAVIVDLPVGDQSASEFKKVSREKHDQKDVFIESRISQATPFPYWSHIGTVGMGSGIYLGHGYVLTSAHVGCYPFRLTDGSYYKPDYSSWKVLAENSGGRADIAIFRVHYAKGSALALLDAVPIASSSPAAGTAVLMFGSGVRQSPDPSVLRSNGKVLAVLGYGIEAKRSMTWGFNTVIQNQESPVAIGKFNTRCLVTEFDNSAFEAQAADGDSGGASFIFDPLHKRWELAGCIVAVTQRGSYVPFGSRTYFANLAVYRSQFPLAGSADAEGNGEPAPTESVTTESVPTESAPTELEHSEKPLAAAAPSASPGVPRPAVIGVMIPD